MLLIQNCTFSLLSPLLITLSPFRNPNNSKNTQSPVFERVLLSLSHLLSRTCLRSLEPNDPLLHLKYETRHPRTIKEPSATAISCGRSPESSPGRIRAIFENSSRHNKTPHPAEELIFGIFPARATPDRKLPPRPSTLNPVRT